MLEKSSQLRQRKGQQPTTKQAPRLLDGFNTGIESRYVTYVSL
jgi:hypothetical protein